MVTAVRPRRRKKAVGIKSGRVDEKALGGGNSSTSDATGKFMVADLFCGAGGTSTGATKAMEEMGADIELVAVNHWNVAVETHRRNHPAARHYVEDLDGADPERLVPEGRLDLLMASPECRFFSRARGGKPMSEQGRMNPWIVHRWVTALDVRTLLVENVPEFTSWAPLMPNGRPDKSRRGLYFEQWVRSLWGLGYDVEWRILNAADYGDATSRVRFFLQARKDGRPIRWPEATHSRTGGEDMLGSLPKWRGAREIIDWSNVGRSLLDDPKYKRRPLSVNTRRRIARGLRRFGGSLADYYIGLLDLDDELADVSVSDAGSETRAFHGSDRQNTAPRDMEEPIPTVTTWGNGGCYMVQPVARPFLLGQQSCGAPRDAVEPVPTIAAAGAISVIRPIIVEYYGKGESRIVDEPLSTATTKGRHALTQATAIPLEMAVSESAGDGGKDEDSRQKVCACIIPNFGERANQVPRVHDVDAPTPAVTSRGAGCLLTPTVLEVDEVGGDVDPKRLVLIDGQLHLLDIRYRMLQNPELARAMGFSDEEQAYEFVGNVTEITKQIGNAVPVRIAAALVKAVLGVDEALGDKVLGDEEAVV